MKHLIEKTKQNEDQSVYGRKIDQEALTDIYVRGNDHLDTMPMRPWLSKSTILAAWWLVRLLAQSNSNFLLIVIKAKTDKRINKS